MTVAETRPYTSRLVAWLRRFYDSTLGKKVLMAVTGVVLFGFILGHLAGNLQIWNSPLQFDEYAAMLKSNLGLLWGARTLLIFSVALHILVSVQLTLRNRAARPLAYEAQEYVASNYAQRTMWVSGPIVAAFVIYHLLHFTSGTVHPAFDEHRVANNVVVGFSQIGASVFYIIAVVLLGMHLSHGIWSMLQSLGFSHPRYTPWIKLGARGFAALIVLGYISIPIGVMAGFVR